MLLRFSLGGATYGIDIEQLATIGAYDGEEGDDLCWLHQALAYKKPPSYHAPRVLLVKSAEGNTVEGPQPFRLIIEAPEDVREFDWRDIRPLPALLAPRLSAHGLWGVLPFAGDMILLLDCHRLAANTISNR